MANFRINFKIRFGIHFGILLALWCVFVISPVTRVKAAEQVYIHVGEAEIRKSLMALPSFQFFGGPKITSQAQTVGLNLYNTVYNDLNVSSYFTFIDPKAFLENPDKVGLKPAPGESNGFNFENWKQIGAEFLIRAGYNVVGDKVTLNAYVYFVPQSKLIMGREYVSTVNGSRKLAHTFANDLVKSLTGKQGIFLTKIVAARDAGGPPPMAAKKTKLPKGRIDPRWKEIYIFDWDSELATRSENTTKVTNLRSVTVSPTWAPDGKSILYSGFVYHKGYKSENLDLFHYDLASGKSKIVSARKGNNTGASFLPSGRELLATLSHLGNSDVFRLNLNGKIIKQLTNGPANAMNVETAVSPDGRQVAFSSTRGGFPMLYVMNIDGTNVRRITRAGRYNSTPAWSPDGSKIAFAGQDGSHFDIFLMDSNGLNMSRLTTSPKVSGRPSDNEAPSFSPDGRHVMFTSNRTGKHQIYIVNLDGTNERRLTFDNYNYFKPQWSPYLD